MRQLFFIAALSLISISGFAEEKIDTTYYNRNGQGVAYKEFADYYRISLQSESPLGSNVFRDFHMNGQLMSSGEFISLDKKNDNNSKFVGIISIFDKDGNLSEVRPYKNGVLDGVVEKYLPDGTTIQEEYSAGTLVNDYFTHSDKDGNMIKVRYSDNTIIWESPDPSEISVGYHDGEKWLYYTKNGITIAFNSCTIRDHGKFHALNITIANNSLVPIEFEPSCNITVTSTLLKKNEESPLKVFSFDEYMQKFENRAAWGSFFMGLSEAIALIDGGISEKESVNVNHKGEVSVTYTRSYSAFDNYLEYEMQHAVTKEYEKNIIEEREVRKIGYFKRSTINPGEAVSGHVYVKRIKGDILKAIFEIEGAQFIFDWNIVE